MSAANDNVNTGSTKTFVTATVTSLIIFSALMVGWFIFRKQKRVYQPRSYLVAEKARSRELPTGPLAWWTTVMKEPLDTIIRTNGFDAYTFVRFALMLVKIFVPYFLLTWILLMPLAAVAPNRGQTQLSQFTFGNVGLTVQARYGGYIVALWLLTLWTLWVIYTEVLHYIQARHSFLSSPHHSSLVKSRTVLVSQLADDMMTESAIKDLVKPANVEKIFLVRNVKDLDDVYEDRQDECTKLEKAEGKLLKLANKNIKKGKASSPTQGKDNPEGGDHTLINSVVPIKKRPKRSLGKVPFIGKKVDAIEYSTEQIHESNEKLDKLRANLNDYELASTAIIRFSTQAEAINFAQDRSKAMRKKAPQVYADISPEAIHWPNLGIKKKQFYGRKVAAWTATIALIIFWAPLVALAGAVANLSALCSTVPFLAWVCRLPSVVVGIIQGNLPAIVVAILFLLLPPILTLFSKIQGIPLTTHIELSAFKRYWLFAVINGFLVITAAGGLVPALSRILGSGETPDIPSTLATTLPQASIYFLTFVLISGLSMVGKQMSLTISVLIFKIKSLLGASTPRQKYALEYQLASTPFLKLWPDLSLLAVLGISYSCIQPIITLCALVVFALYYVAFKYLFTFVFDQPDVNETGGLFWPSAVNHIFVGLYIQHLAMTALFFLATDIQGRRSAIPEGVLAVVLLVITILFHLYITKRVKPRHIDLNLFEHHVPQVQADQSKIDAHRAEQEHNGVNGARGPMLRLNTMDNTMDNRGHVGGNPAEHLGNTDAGDLDHGFDPPSTYQEQPTIWVAEDEHGLSRHEVAKIEAAQVKASMHGAHIDKDGTFSVSRGPPDEEWYGGVNT